MDCMVIEAAFLSYSCFSEGHKKQRHRYVAISKGFIVDLQQMVQFRPSDASRKFKVREQIYQVENMQTLGTQGRNSIVRQQNQESLMVMRQATKLNYSVPEMSWLGISWSKKN